MPPPICPLLCQLVGSGGFAEVFRATRVQKGGERMVVAVKQLRVLLDDAENVGQFLREIALMQVGLSTN